MRPLLLPLLMLAAASASHAHAPHAHGVGELDLALEAGSVSLSLRLPGDTVVGFERAPADDDERAAVEAARAMLHEGRWLVLVDAQACRSLLADVRAPGAGTGGDAGQGKAHPSPHQHALHHGHGAGGASEPAAHARRHDDDHAHGHASGHDHAHAHDHAHEDWTLSFELACGAATRPTAIDFGGLFTQLPRLERLRVQWIDDRGQHAATLTPDNTRLPLDR
jgi:hypothetical protein